MKAALALAVLAGPALAADNGKAITPPLGWCVAEWRALARA